MHGFFYPPLFHAHPLAQVHGRYPICITCAGAPSKASPLYEGFWLMAMVLGVSHHIYLVLLLACCRVQASSTLPRRRSGGARTTRLLGPSSTCYVLELTEEHKTIMYYIMKTMKIRVISCHTHK